MHDGLDEDLAVSTSHKEQLAVQRLDVQQLSSSFCIKQMSDRQIATCN